MVAEAEVSTATMPTKSQLRRGMALLLWVGEHEERMTTSRGRMSEEEVAPGVADRRWMAAEEEALTIEEGVKATKGEATENNHRSDLTTKIFLLIKKESSKD